jgi:isopentenyl diphosphate isomerase/L-lactate dehydrogenase-like FMN-dependent dehydrogenase
MDDAPTVATVDDYEPIARACLDRGIYDYIAGAAGDERTYAENIAAFDRWHLRPRYLRGAAEPDPRTTLLGADLAAPIVVAPWALQRAVHPDGELATRRAASDEGSLMVVSSTAYDLIEEVGAAASGPAWWQLYLANDRGFSADMLARVAAAGYRALVWTVDLVAWGLRHRDTRNAFEPPEGLVAQHYDYDLAMTWEDLGWIREHAGGLPVLVKGILTAEDARLAVDAGADGISVSNHGGRQLDGVITALDALPEIVEAVAGRVPVLLDGGIRRGTHVVTALALGADAVMVARPIAWGLAAAGADGVRDVLRILREETLNAMAQVGARSVGELTRDLVAPAPA